MSFSIQRLTLFALLDAMERDLRNFIRNHLLATRDVAVLLTAEELNKCTKRLRKNVDAILDAKDNGVLIEYLDFADSAAIILRSKTLLPKPMENYFATVAQDIQLLVPIRNTVMHGRPLQLHQFSLCSEAAAKFVKRPELWVALSEMVQKISSDNGYVLKLNFKILEDTDSQILNNLPIPDFDDTGFVGRDKSIKEIQSAIKGPFPVITIVGEGGLGKTAAVLNVAYNVLEEKNNAFDAVIWSTAKTTILTPRMIQEISESITTLTGLFTNIAITLDGNVKEADAESLILEYMSNFRLLLVIDNLETVLDERVQEFVKKIPVGSKVVFTSRVSLGAMDYPIRLEPFDDHEARYYLRELIRCYPTPSLSKINDTRIDQIAKRLNRNPLFLKWFVLATQQGMRQEELLADPVLALEFCMQNVFGSLTEEALTICYALVTAGGRHTQAILGHLTDYDYDVVQKSLASLLSSQIVYMPQNNDGETVYELRDLARAYLIRKLPAKPEVTNRIIARYRQLQSLEAQEKQITITDHYNINRITARNQKDILPVGMLRRALIQLRRNDLGQALELANEAERWAPGYYEVKRIKALVLREIGDVAGARACFESAIELEPKQATLRYFFGGFLLREISVDEGIKQLGIAMELDPVSGDVKCEYARALMIANRFEEAKAVSGVLVIEKYSYRTQMKCWDLHISVLARYATTQSRQHDFSGALKTLEELVQNLSLISDTFVDDRVRSHVDRVVSVSRRVKEHFARGEDGQFAATAAEIYKRILVFVGAPFIATSPDNAELSGVVLRLPENKPFGFIGTSDGREYYFQAGSVVAPLDFRKLSVGDHVLFNLGFNSEGPCAIGIQWNRS